MTEVLKNIVAGIADFALFFLLWLYFGIPWYIAFVLSTLIVLGLWWLLAWIFGWTAWWLRGE